MTEQVLVTGISGFIAKHVALELLKQGYEVRGTVRSLARADEVKDTLARHGANVDRVSFIAADLGSPEGWADAAQGCAYVQHIASPFPIEAPQDRESLVPEAREGALRVLRAAKRAGAKRVVFTSSMVAMMYRSGRPPVMTVTEDDWTDADWPATSAYVVSKTRAERAAWDWARAEGISDRLTTVNPGFVLGPALDPVIGTSLQVIQLFMTGAYPAVPPVTYPVVDVRDLADLHVKAMTAPEAGGRRLMATGEPLSLTEMAHILREAFPDRAKKIPTMTMPAIAIRILALFDASLKSLIQDLGTVPKADSSYVSDLTGVRFRPSREAVIDAGQSLIDFKQV